MKRLIFSSVFVALLISSFAQQRPNVILMLADDMGYSDIAAFGSEVPTPNIDRLVDRGTSFTQFYNGARCCPTRASLITGLYAHQAGVGYMNQSWNEDGYQGHLDDQARTAAEIMKSNDYRTFMVGKWHIGNVKNHQTPFERGFDRSWWRHARVDYFRRSGIMLDGKDWTTEDQHYYLTDYTGNYILEFIDESVKSEKPFFGYVGWDACHWPLQAKEQYIQEFLETYQVGWDLIRQQRITNQLELGLIDPKWSIPGRDPKAPEWSDLSPADQQQWTRKMATYAAQLKSLDENIGRVLDKLDELGIADNTYVMILFDNGACAEAIGWQEDSLIGGPDSYTSYNLPWANVSNTPFRTYKHFLNEGGISTPFIIAGPRIPNGVTTSAVGHIIDVVPTILDLTKSTFPNEKGVKKLEGQSLVPAFKQGAAGREWTFWEHEGNRAVRFGDWKLVSRFEHDTTYFSRWHFPGAPRAQEWELYNLKDDRTEMNEVSGENPALVEQMQIKWQEWANRVGALQTITSYDGQELKTK